MKRLKKRMTELEQKRQLSPLPPVAVGGALILPIGLLRKLGATSDTSPPLHAKETAAVELAAMNAVMKIERDLGYEPRDVSKENLGYDVESRVPGAGTLRFIEVKGRAKGADAVTVTRNEILTALNKPESFILAIVEVDGEATEARYLLEPFDREPDFAATSVNFNIRKLLRDGELRGTVPVEKGDEL